MCRLSPTSYSITSVSYTHLKSPDLFDRAAGEGRDSQVICPFCHTHATFDRLHHLFARMVVGQKIPFVEQDNDGAAALDGEIGDLLVLFGHTSGRVDNEQGNIGTVDCAKSANHRVVFDILVHSALFTNASSVYKAILLVSALDDGINGIARGAGDVGHNGTIGTKNLVEQGGLAGIGPTDDGDGENAIIDLFFLIRFGKQRDDIIEKVTCSKMCIRDRPTPREG